MLPCPPKELLERLLLGSHRDGKQESSVLVFLAAGHLLRQGQSSPFPWDRRITVVRVARRKRLRSEPAVRSPGRPATSSAPWQEIVPGACHGMAPACDTRGRVTLTTAQPGHTNGEEFFLCVQTQSSAWYRLGLYFPSSFCWAAAAMFFRAVVQAGSIAPDILCSVCLQQLSHLQGLNRIIRGLRAGQSLSGGWGNLQMLTVHTPKPKGKLN